MAILIRNTTAKNIGNVASIDGNRTALGGVHLKHIQKDGMNFVESVASNGKALIKVTEIMQDHAEYPKYEGQNGFESGLIPADALKKAGMNAKSKRLPILQNISISRKDDDRLIIATTNLQEIDIKTVMEVQGTYPAYEKAMPTYEAETEIVFDAELLANVLLTMHKVIGNRKGQALAVKFSFKKDHPKSDAVKLFTRSQDFGEIEAVVMPMAVKI